MPATYRDTATLMALLTLAATGVQAQPYSSENETTVAQRRAWVRAHEDDLAKTRRDLAELRARVDALAAGPDRRAMVSDRQLDSIRAGQALPQAPVGERPLDTKTSAEIAALPEGMNVLAQPGRFILTPSIEYTRSSSNRLIFRGVEIVPGIQLGLIDANQVASDTGAAALNFRAGILERLEVEVRLPYVLRHNSLTTVSQQVTTGTPGVTRTTNLSGNGIGDVEFLARYQINAPTDEEPIYIASIRTKSTTGRGPFDVNFDASGVATSLATGTGFWAAGPGLTVILPSDPAVLFANVGYLHNFSRNINKTIGTTPVGEVSPGDALDMALGFGLALNPKFSFSLGYSHSMIFPTTTMLGTTSQRSNTLQAGSLTMGWSYQFSEHFSLNNNFSFGVTSDAPNLLITFRVPYAF